MINKVSSICGNTNVQNKEAFLSDIIKKEYKKSVNKLVTAFEWNFR